MVQKNNMTTRLHHPRGWYADVPVQATAVLGDALTRVVMSGCAASDLDAPHVLMRGIVVAHEGTDAVVSCHGLMMRGPGEATRVGDDVCVVLQ